jgi:hypothetical protein
MSFRSSHVRTRLHNAVEHLATSDHKLKERVFDAWDCISVLLAKEFPDRDTQHTFDVIEAKSPSVAWFER